MSLPGDGAEGGAVGSAHTFEEAGIGYGSSRWWPARLGGVVFLLVLALTVIGVIVAALGSWRWGTRLVGISLLVGAVARTVIPQEAAGMLAVRRKLVDVPVLLLLGTAIAVLSVSIPDQG